MQKRYFVILLSALLVLSMSIMAGLEDRKEVQQLEDRQEVTAPVSRAACTMTKTSGVGWWTFQGFSNSMGIYTYFDPAVECGPTPYPFELTSFSLSFADLSGSTWPVQFDVVVRSVTADGNPCNGPQGVVCRFWASADKASFDFPAVGTVFFPSLCCITEPVFIGIEYTSGVAGSTPSIVFDDNPAPATCENWARYIDGVYYEWSNYWSPPVPGYPLFWVDGETQSVNCGATACDWAVGDPDKMHFPQLPNDAGWAVNATAPLVLADDWRCSETGWIKDLHWWGGWRNGLEGQIVSFVLSIHADIPASQNPDGYSKPGTTLWEMEVPFDQISVNGIDPPAIEGWYDPANGEIIYDDHQPYFQYNFCLPEHMWFWQDVGVIYWVNISAVVVDPVTKWGWKSTLDHWNDDAVWAEWGDLKWVDLYEPGTGSLPGRQNDFYIFMDPSGLFIDGGGTDFYGEGWYYYPWYDWWNIWFYDHPFAATRYKLMHLEFDAHPLDPALPSYLEVAINWSTDNWSLDQPPSDSAPPLPGVDEDLYIGRKIFLATADFEGHYIFDFPFQDYNPEWVSIDVRGVNFAIPGGFLYHECLPSSDPISMDMAFVVTGEPPVEVGACCYDPTGGSMDAACVVTTQADCEYNLGGVYQGDGTTCGQPEACCMADGSCMMADPLCCTSMGGQPQGPGTDCTAPEACCLPDGSCLMVDPLCCDEMGGTPHGPGTTCTTPQACCMQDGSCMMADPICCTRMGGTPQGAGTACTAPEACCLPDGSCVMADPNCCLGIGGTPQGSGSTCAAPEACCLADGTCIDADPLCCLSMGGTPRGPGTDCASISCGDPTGACCLPDNTCVDGLTGAECTNAANLGTYMGDNSVCLGDLNGNGQDDLCESPWEPGDGHKMHYPQLPDEAGWDVNATFPILAADDWMCGGSGWVSDLHFWGSWRHGIEGKIQLFMFSIYADIPAVESPTGYSMPGPELWTFETSEFVATPLDPPSLEGWYDPSREEIFPDDHQAYFQYDVFFDTNTVAFWQEEGRIYWISITAFVENDQEYHWGWKSSVDHWNDDAVWGIPGAIEWMELYEPGTGSGYPYTLGDVDGDGDIDDDDVFMLTAWLMGGDPPPTSWTPNGIYWPAADVNGDCLNMMTDIGVLAEHVASGGTTQLRYCPQYPPGEAAVSLDLSFVITGTGEDCDCYPGEANYDLGVNVGDAVYLINYVFKGGLAPKPYPICSGDGNCDCGTNVGDAVYIINHVFKGGPAPCDCEEWKSRCGSPHVK